MGVEVGLPLGVFLVLEEVDDAEGQLARRSVHFDDSRGNLVADLEGVAGAADGIGSELGGRDEAFEAAIEFHDYAALEEAGDLGFDFLADGKLVRYGIPGIFLE